VLTRADWQQKAMGGSASGGRQFNGQGSGQEPSMHFVLMRLVLSFPFRAYLPLEAYHRFQLEGPDGERVDVVIHESKPYRTQGGDDIKPE
jgi:hypothetical protein